MNLLIVVMTVSIGQLGKRLQSKVGDRWQWGSGIVRLFLYASGFERREGK
jgi:hypothetical protein